MVLDWYPTTIWSVPPPPEALPATVHPAKSGIRAAPATSVLFIASPSAQQVRHVHGHGTGRTPVGTRAAVPALVHVHVRLAGLGVDGERVQRADVDTQRAAVDAEGLVHGHGDVGAVSHKGHGYLQ